MTALAPHILSSRPARAVHPSVCPAEGVTLAPGRAHEVCGPARRAFAVLTAAALDGPVIWIAPAWNRTHLNPSGLTRWIDPGRLLHVQAEKEGDLLWCLEEVLRAGTVPLAVADLPGPPGLVAVRRLHLAAETGAATSGRAPLGLLLTPEGNAPGIESRWSMRPACQDGAPRWRVDRLRARTLPETGWEIDAGGRLL